MSATRYSGKLKIRVTLCPPKGGLRCTYRCYIRLQNRSSQEPILARIYTQTVTVEAPQFEETDRDSSEAFTLAAVYALKYARKDIQDLADFGVAGAESFAVFKSLRAQEKALREHERVQALSPAERETEKLVGRCLDKGIKPVLKENYSA